MGTRKILSAYDFTERGKFAIEHAMKIGKFVHADIQLIHVVSSNSDLHVKQKQLKKVADKFNRFYPYNLDSEVLKGNITSIINNYADSINAIMVVLGTKAELKGFEVITGSKTLKIIVGSITPFLVVQDYPKSSSVIKDIVFPISFSSENKQKLLWAKYLDKYFNVKIKMLVEHYNDDLTTSKINANLLFSKRYLNKYDIDYEITLSKGKQDFESEIISFADSANAHLIMIMTEGSVNVADVILGDKDHMIIFNKSKIPVMCVNPRLDFKRYQAFF